MDPERPDGIVERLGAVLTERHAAWERDAERVGRVAAHFEAAAEAAAGMPSDQESARREASRVLDRSPRLRRREPRLVFANAVAPLQYAENPLMER